VARSASLSKGAEDVPNRAAVIFVLALCVSCSSQAPPPERGTPAEARTMLERAVAHYEQVGRTQALADFTARKAPFADRDLYVFCFGPDRTTTAHGADPKLLGVKVDDLKDVDGKAFGTEMWTVGHQPGGGSVEYKWQNPATNQVEPKVSVVRKVGDEVCGVGAYK
jgi:hypothetical protein